MNLADQTLYENHSKGEIRDFFLGEENAFEIKDVKEVYDLTHMRLVAFFILKKGLWVLAQKLKWCWLSMMRFWSGHIKKDCFAQRIIIILQTQFAQRPRKVKRTIWKALGGGWRDF